MPDDPWSDIPGAATDETLIRRTEMTLQVLAQAASSAPMRASIQKWWHAHAV